MTFEPGERVRTRNDNPEGHTRLPTYLRAREGCVVRSLGTFPFPDERSKGNRGAAAVMLYTVRFEGPTVWGAGGEGLAICADLFEPYLEKLS